MPSDSALDANWSSRWRPVRDVAALLVLILALVAVPYGLLFDALSGVPVERWGDALSRNAGLVLVGGLWTLLVLVLYGGHLRAAFADYRRHF